ITNGAGANRLACGSCREPGIAKWALAERPRGVRQARSSTRRGKCVLGPIRGGAQPCDGGGWRSKGPNETRNHLRNRKGDRGGRRIDGRRVGPCTRRARTASPRREGPRALQLV